jgi:phosphonate transport system substrate-binding protein
MHKTHTYHRRNLIDGLRVHAVLAMWLIGCGVQAAAAGPVTPVHKASLRFAPLPMENREATVKAFNPLVTHLEKILARPVTLVYLDSYAGIVDAFTDNHLDLVFFGPLPYVMMRQKNKATEPLVFFKEPDGTVSYRCVLLGFADDQQRMSNLRGKRFGLTQRLSTCGYLATDALLRNQAGVSLGKTDYRYLGSHENVIRAVVSGRVDIGAVKEEFALKFATLGIDILARSSPVPGVGLAGNGNTLDKATLDKLRGLLLATPKTTYQHWGGSIRYGMAPAKDSDFDSLRALGDVDAIPPEPVPRATLQP